MAQQHTTEGATTYTYDPVGNLLRVVGGQTELTYERDARGRVLAETCNGATVRSVYDVLGRRIRRVTPSNAESTWEYDGNDRPTHAFVTLGCAVICWRRLRTALCRE
ncbi:hypothetical protein [Streptomyces sp. NBC_00576]|uniref:hypothetical protein n=1 Tax=Streptomyces sp. NBC_00576 TaxID=2903665 RepID=UPI002E81AEF5|nr:hypothetical protein [Streptomyces sp. NBC_00576]WUB71393.1 hypothetical protein OG734_15520 [Streptomyces sp. NBC_00576]